MCDYTLIAISAVILIALDYAYISLNKKMFETQVIKVQKTAMIPNTFGFILCYVFIILGLYYFIIRTHKRPIEAFILGIFVYGVYELTNYSIFKKWSPMMVVMDTTWGGILFYVTTYLVYKIEKYMTK